MRSIDVRKEQKKRISRLLGCFMACVLIASSISNWDVKASANEKSKQVYLNGVLGSDSNTGNTIETAVKTFKKAKELLETNGTIIISGQVFVSEEETWSLPASTYGTATVKVTIEESTTTGYSNKATSTPAIYVSAQGKLTLNNITIIGQTNKLITNKGIVCLDTGSVFKNRDDIIDEVPVLTLPGGTTLMGDQVVTKIEAELLENTLRIGCDNVAYGQSPSPYVIENKSGGDVTFQYKVKGEPDSTYVVGVPKETGSYTVIGISVITDTYQSATAYADFEITKATPGSITFPVASCLMEGNSLSDSQLSSGLGNGTFAWADAAQIATADNDGYEVIFTPNDTTNYDYSAVAGWDCETGVVRRTIAAEVLSIESTTETDTPETKQEKGTRASDESGKSLENKEESKEIVEETNTDAQAANSGSEEPSVESNVTDAVPAAELNLSAAAKKSYDYILALPAVIDNTETAAKVLEATRIYNALSADDKKQIPDTVALALSEAQSQAGTFNHTSNGITVTGGTLPWYTQLRVSVKARSEHADEVDLKDNKIIIPYEIRLWNLMEQNEYTLLEGTEVTLTMPAPDLDKYEDIIILHYLSDGTVEYITPTFSENEMSFKTSSFSPFDIAGSISLVPGNTSGSSKDNTDSTSDTNGTGNTNNTNNTSSTSSTNSTNSSNNSTNKNSDAKKSTVRTGDNNPILLLIAGLVLAVSLIAILVITRKKDKNKNKSEQSLKDSESDQS